MSSVRDPPSLRVVEVEVVARLRPFVAKRFASDPNIEGVFVAPGRVTNCHSGVPDAFVPNTCPGSAPPGSAETTLLTIVWLEPPPAPPPLQNTKGMLGNVGAGPAEPAGPCGPCGPGAPCTTTVRSRVCELAGAKGDVTFPCVPVPVGVSDPRPAPSAPMAAALIPPVFVRSKHLLLFVPISVEKLQYVRSAIPRIPVTFPATSMF